jgi:hypothetical protein
MTCTAIKFSQTPPSITLEGFNAIDMAFSTCKLIANYEREDSNHSH